MDNVEMIDWQKAIKEINLIDFFRYKMPSFFYDSNRKAFVDHFDPKQRSDKFEFFLGKDGNQNYISRATGNGGNLIHFIKNHIATDSNNVWKEINKELNEYRNNLPRILEEVRSRESLQNYPNQAQLFHNRMQEDFQVQGEFLPLHERQLEYITKFRKINKETIDSPLFKNVVQSYKSISNFYSIGLKIKDIDEKVVGVIKTYTNEQYDNFNIKKFEINSKNDIAFSTSNKLPTSPGEKQGARNLTITESVWDALSHYELKYPKNTEYLFSNGEISLNKSYIIKQFYDKRAYTSLSLAMDNDKKGHQFELFILSQFIPDMKVNYVDNKFISVGIIYDENNLDSSQFRQMIRGFSKIDQENLKYLNDNVPTKEFIRKLIVEEKGISFIKKDKEKYYEIIIPMQKNYLALFNEQIIRIFNSVAKKVEIEKSITKDWNDDLRKIKSEIYNQTYNQEQKQLNPNNSKGPKI